jgi:hypothetical protein
MCAHKEDPRIQSRSTETHPFALSNHPEFAGRFHHSNLREKYMTKLLSTLIAVAFAAVSATAAAQATPATPAQPATPAAQDQPKADKPKASKAKKTKKSTTKKTSGKSKAKGKTDTTK